MYTHLYSLTSPYAHLYNTDTSLSWTVCLVPEMPKIIHSLPYNIDNSVKRTLGSIPLVSVLKRFDWVPFLQLRDCGSSFSSKTFSRPAILQSKSGEPNIPTSKIRLLFFMSCVHCGTYRCGICGWWRDQTGILSTTNKNISLRLEPRAGMTKY